MPGRKEYRGASGILTLTAGITAAATSCFADGVSTGWPTGVLYPFVIRIDAGGANEEKILCSSLVAGTPNQILFVTRGYDGTTASLHGPGAPVQHCLDADSFDTFADHVFNTTRDDHTQYLKTDGSRPPTNVGGWTAAPVGVGTALAAGTANTLARSDHVHNLNAGAINSPTLFAAGVVDSAAIANGAIAPADLAAGAVTTPAILDANVTLAKLAPNSVDSSKIVDGSIGVADLSQSGYRITTICTSSTRPASPNVGDMIFETDTNRMFSYTSNGWQPLPWNSAWGVLMKNTRTTNLLAQTDGTILATFGGSVTVAPNRFTCVEVHLGLINKNTAGAVKIAISRDSLAERCMIYNHSMVDSERDAVDGAFTFTALTSGAHQFDLIVYSTAGTVDFNCTTLANGDPGPGTLLVRDAGPSALPY